MAESTFNAGPRAALDLRECSGMITLQDGDEPTIRIAAEGEHAPFVLREGDSFRVRMPGGTITLPAGLPVEVSVPPAGELRIEREARGGGGTGGKPVSPPPAAAEQERPGRGA